MTIPKKQRQRILVDQQVQGALFRRVVAYWLACVLVIGLMVTAQVLFTAQHATMQLVIQRSIMQFGPALVAAVIVLPFILIDCLRITNKFAGPVSRLRRAMDTLAEGNEVDHLEFRKSDFWSDVAEAFNRIVDRVEREGPAESDMSRQDKDQLADTVKLS